MCLVSEQWLFVIPNFDFGHPVFNNDLKVLSICLFSRYETESVGKIDELEHAKMKLQARLAEAEETIEGLNTR